LNNNGPKLLCQIAATAVVMGDEEEGDGNGPVLMPCFLLWHIQSLRNTNGGVRLLNVLRRKYKGMGNFYICYSGQEVAPVLAQ
jgi:hypothetical protein